MERSWEWDTMAAVVGHLGHDVLVSTDVVGCCDVCFGG